MSASIVQYPPAAAFSESEDLRAIIATNLIDTQERGFFHFQKLNSDTPSVSDTFSLSWGVHTLVFSVADIPDTSGLQIPTAASSDLIADTLRNNALIDADFTIFTEDENIKIYYSGDATVTLSASGTLSGYLLVTSEYASPYLQPNLTAFLKCYSALDNTMLGCPMVQPYRISDTATTFDLRSAFADIAQPLPFWYAQNFIVANTRRYYFRYADRYGIPTATETLQKSLNMVVIKGKQPATFINTNLVCLSEYPTLKEVRIDQPDWLYFFCLETVGVINIQVDMIYSDGTIVEKPIALNYEDIVPGTVVHFATGLKQLGLFDESVGSVCLTGYTWRLMNTNGTVHRQEYVIDEQKWHPWNTYLLLENGCGGMETIRLKGKKATKEKSERTIIENENSTQSVIFAKSRTSFEVSTGWLPLNVIEHIKKLLTHPIWLIDPSKVPYQDYSPDYVGGNYSAGDYSKTFIPVIADTDSFDIEVDDTDLYALNFAFRHANTSF